MQNGTQTGKTLFLVTAVVLTVAALVVAGCTAGSPLASNSGTGTTINTATTSVPISITDAPGDQVLAATLTLNSVVLKDSNGGTASLLTTPLTFEATHLDAVQEPLFIPAVPQATYTSVTLNYSSPIVAYIDATTKQVIVANGTLANTSATITFPSPITINSTRSTLLIDYLVAKSVAITGSTVTVTPTFHISSAPIRTQPTNGIEGLHVGVRGKVAALGTNQFTLVNPAGISVNVSVNSNTQYEDGLTAFSGIAVGMFVEVDLELQTDGTLLAKRMELEEAPNPVLAMLVGPVTAVTGSPATSFKQIVRQQEGTATTTPVQTDTITINSSTKFLLPGRMQDVSKIGLPFTPTFDASSIFAGQVVAVATSGVTSNAATALGVRLAPQTLAGTIATLPSASCTMWCQYTITLPATNWVAILTGKATVNVWTPPMGMMQDITSSTLAVGDSVRFNGFLFNNNGTLTMIAMLRGPGPGTAIDQH
jgi:Domain of unknown function (DUF5666)